MWKAVLFDLDGTLLDNDMDTFARRFMERLVGAFGHLVAPDRLVKRAMDSTVLMATHDGAKSNAEVFAEAFYPLGDRSVEESAAMMAAFYEGEFRKLEKHTARRPEARVIVERVIALGCDVVLATNPVFPESAIRQRMAWAGVDGVPFKWVTTIENSRSAKPNPRYYADILAKLGHAGTDCLMVGDEAGDMVAAKLGCATFLVPSATTKLAEGAAEPTHRGSLAEVLAVIEA